MNIASLCAAAVCASALILCLRTVRPDIAQALAVAASVLLFAAVLPYCAEIVKSIKDFTALGASGGRYIVPIMKITGIAYISQLSAELCSDAGEKALAARVEMAGKIAICIITLPIAKEVFIKITGILN